MVLLWATHREAIMKVGANTVVTISYDVYREDGEIVESSGLSGPVTFVHGNSKILRSLDQKMEGMENGQEATFEFTPEQAFGRPEDGPTKLIARKEFPAGTDLKVGARFEAGIPGGQKITLLVLSATEDAVQVRMIHPLAGQKIAMTIKILGVRLATKEERTTGNAMPSRA
jgi:FKBP-type peptidyl-prolyl cis-trans isomerase 2